MKRKAYTIEIKQIHWNKTTRTRTVSSSDLFSQFHCFNWQIKSTDAKNRHIHDDGVFECNITDFHMVCKFNVHVKTRLNREKEDEKKSQNDRTVNVQLDGFDEHGQIKHEVKHTKQINRLRSVNHQVSCSSCSIDGRKQCKKKTSKTRLTPFLATSLNIYINVGTGVFNAHALLKFMCVLRVKSISIEYNLDSIGRTSETWPWEETKYRIETGLKYRKTI